MQEKVDELYQEYLKDKLDLVFNVEEKEEPKHSNDDIIDSSDFKEEVIEDIKNVDDKEFSIIKKDNKYNYINTKGEIISPNLWFDDIDVFENGYAKVKINGKYNYINTKGEILSPNLWFDIVWSFKNGYAFVEKDGKDNYINTKGEILSPNLWFEGVWDFENGYAKVKKDGKWNYINTEGQIISPNLWFEGVWNFENGFAAVGKDGKWNYINTEGQIISPNLWFDDASEFSNGCARVKKDGKWNYINTEGQIISPNLWFDYASEFSNGYAYVQKDGKMNYINTEGQILSPNLWFDDANVFQNGYAKVKINDKWNYINTKGEIQSTNLWFDYVWNYKGYAIVRKNGKCNYINTKGELLSPNLWFDSAYNFSNGYAEVRKNGKYNYINTKGELLSPNLWFDSAYDFSNGYAKVKRNGKYNFINTKGELLSNKWYGHIELESCNDSFVKHKDIICLKKDLKNYQVQRKIFGYECNNGIDSFKIKYEPIKIYGIRYILCLDKENVVLFDRVANDYTNLGTVKDIEFDDNFIFDNKNGRVYLVYENIIKDVTEYYNNYLRGKKIIGVNKGVIGILSREEFALLNMKQIDEMIEREKRKNDEIKKQQEKEQIKKEREEQKRRLQMVRADHIKKQQEEEEKKKEEKIEALKQIHEALIKLKGLKNGEIPVVREKISDIFVMRDNYKEIDKDYIEILMLIDLLNIKFDNVKVTGIDFSETNLEIDGHNFDPQKVYKKDLRKCNFEGIYVSPFASFDGVDIRGAKFSIDKDIKTADFIPNFANAIYDEETTYNGKLISELMRKENKKLK